MSPLRLGANVIHATFLLGYLALYLGGLVALSGASGYPISEAVGTMAVFAIGLPLVAYAVTWKVSPLGEVAEGRAAEWLALALSAIAVIALLAVGPGALGRWLGLSPGSPASRMIELACTWIAFVVVPGLVFVRLRGLRLSQLGLCGQDGAWYRSGHLRVFLAMAIVVILLQWVASRSFDELRADELTLLQWATGALFASLWLFLKVGIAEEFFFRVLVQARSAALLNSPIAGLVIGATLFGLAHVPGLWLRPSVHSPLGEHASVLLVTGHAIVVLSAAGLFLGVIWWRTRNLWLVAAIHTVTDLLPTLPAFMP